MSDPLATLRRATHGLVLGSGIRVLEDLEDRVDLPYTDLPGIPPVTVVGHQGVLTVGTLPGGPTIAIARGRFHLYEGHTPEGATAILRLFRHAGIRKVILTNAAGGLVPTWTPGDLMVIDDHLNLMGVRVPYEPIDALGVPDDLSAGHSEPGTTCGPYDPAWSDRLHEAGLRLGIPLRRGVYAGVLGPSYETPAEIRWITRAGAHAVGMSTVPEALYGGSHGMAILGISCITNVAATTEGQAGTSHQEVVDVAAAASRSLDRLLREALT